MIPKAISNCQTKKAYPNKETADDQVEYLYLNHNASVESYHCNICNAYHLTKRKSR